MVPENAPNPRAAISNERNGCHLNLTVVIIINTIARRSKIISHI
jgi:hypothetical protein